MAQRGRKNSKQTFPGPQPFSAIFNLDIGLPENEVPQGLPATTLTQSRGRRKSNSLSGTRTTGGGRGKVILQPITTPEPKRNTPGGATTPSRGRGAKKKVNSLPSANRLLSAKKVLPEINKYECLILGNLQNLPSAIPSIVRIFLSSTFSDYRNERNALVHKAYPVLREFCQEHDLQFQVVDLRWGITDDVSNDHMVEALCKREIQMCQRWSLGPNFVTLLGNRYGFLPLPATIPAETFEVLLQVAESLNLDTALMTSWYWKDENARPPERVLQPINSKLPHFTDHSSENEGKQKEDSARWKETSTKLQELIEEVVSKAFSDSLISKDDGDKYLQSVTNDEIQHGVINAENPTESALCFLRDFTNYSVDNDDPTQWRYFNIKEMDGSLVRNDEIDNRLDNLKASVFPTKYSSKENIVSYKLPWKQGGISLEQESHQKYMDKFCDDFVKKVKNLIDGSLYQVDDELKKMASFSVKLDKNTSMQTEKGKRRASNDPNVIPGKELFLGNFEMKNIICELNAVEKSTMTVTGNRKKLFAEILYHLSLCRERCDTFQGRDRELKVVESYFKSESRTPLVVYSDSGVGKTSFMAMVHKTTKEVFQNGCTITRFFGTSPESSKLLPALSSVCENICAAYGEVVHYSELQQLKKATEYFQSLLAYISVRYGNERPLVLVLDGVDQLGSAQNSAHTFKWLPKICPQNVKIVVSTLPDVYDCLQNATAQFQGKDNFLKLEKLPPNVGLAIVNQELERNNRLLTDKQKKVISYFVTEECHPLLLKLAADHAITWKSYETEFEVQLNASIPAMIEIVFEKLEDKFGKEFVRKTLGYITLSLNGLSEIEIEDILSCDDAVLDDVYRYHDPPIDGVVRIPPLMWARLRYDLKEYITERTLAKRTVLTWYYRQFRTVALEKYTTGDNSKELHRSLAEMYAADSSVKRTIHLSHRCLTIENVDRLVSVQHYSPNNVNKLVNIAYHAVSSEDEAIKKSLLLENLQFIVNLCGALSLSQQRMKSQDAVEYLSQVNQLIADVVVYCSNQSGKSAQKMLANMCSNLLPYSSNSTEIKNLCDKMLDGLKNVEKPMKFIPVTGIVNHGQAMKWMSESALSLLNIHGSSKLAVFGQSSFIEKKPLLQIIDCNHGLVVHKLDRNGANGVSQYVVICAMFGRSTNKVFALLKTKFLVWDYIGNTAVVQSNDINKKGALNTGLLTSYDDHYLILYNANRMVMFEEDGDQYKVKKAMDLGGATATTNMIFSQDLNLTISTHTIKSKSKEIGAVVYWDFWGEKLRTRIALPAPVCKGGLYHHTSLGQTDVVLCCLTDGGLFLVDVPNGSVLKSIGNIKMSSAYLLTCYDQNNAILSVAHKTTMKVWDINRGAELQAIKIEHKVSSLQSDLDGNLVAAQESGNITLYHSTKYSKLMDHQCHHGSVSHVFYLDDGSLITCGANRTFVSWNLAHIFNKKRAEKAEETLPFVSVTDAAVTSDGQIVTANDHKVAVWSCEDGKEVLSMNCDAARIYSLKSSVILWSENLPKIVKLWDMKNPAKELLVDDDIIAISTSNSDKFLVLHGSSTFTIYDSEGKLVKSLKSQMNCQNVIDIVFSEDHALVYVQWNDSTSSKDNAGSTKLTAIDLESTNEGATYVCDIDKINTFTVNNQGKVYLGLRGKIGVWSPRDDTKTKSGCQTLFNNKGKEDNTQVTCLITRDVDVIAGTKSGNVFILKQGSSSTWECLGSHKAKVTSGIIMDDGIMVTSSLDGTVSIWNQQEKRVTDKIHVGQPVAKLMAVNNDRLVIMTTKMEDKRISIWNILNTTKSGQS